MRESRDLTESSNKGQTIDVNSFQVILSPHAQFFPNRFLYGRRYLNPTLVADDGKYNRIGGSII